MKRILVTGANGQLGQGIRSISEAYSALEFMFTDREQLDITNGDSVRSFFGENRPDYCINCAAYTAVDRAEKESDRCFEINVRGVQNLVAACTEFQSVLIHISTDFVFDGKKGSPYLTTDQPNPINIYGLSKYKGEQVIENVLKKYFIVRTSWVYSEYGSNFLKTMLRLGEERDEIQVVNDQVGAPTYVGDLADFLIWLVASGKEKFGTYHYSNEGEISWYEFAREIFNIKGFGIKVQPVSSDQFKTAAKRPKYSKLDLGKTQRLLGADLKLWKTSLSKCVQRIS
jgi:dTDP-4-dehydrorhamnose reductase